MNFLVELLEQNEKFKELLKELKKIKGPVGISGLVCVEKAHIIKAILNNIKKPICLLTYNEIQAKKLCEDLKSFGIKTNYFPKREIASYDYIAQSKDLPYERISILNKMILEETNKNQKNMQIKNNTKQSEDIKESNINNLSKNLVIVTTIETAMQKMITKQELYQNKFDIEVGKSYSLDALKETFVKLGYERSELIENQGQFCIRGGIVDVGLSETIGVRIEFWGDEVDSIRYFKISSQRSTEMIKEITIFPAHEFIVDDLDTVVKNIEENYPEQTEDIEQIKAKDYISKIDKYFNQFYANSSSFLDYLSDEYLLFLDENLKINQRQENIILDNNHLIDSLIQKERFVPEAIREISNFEYNFSKRPIIYLEQNDTIKNMPKYYFETREINFYQPELELLISDLINYQKAKKKVCILAGNEINAKKICEVLKEHEVNYKYEENLKEVNQAEIVVTTNSISSGFENYDLNLVVISMQNGFEETTKKKRKLSRQFKEGEKIVFADLKPGDFVVHQTHGIGEFIGVNTITADNITKDYIKIKYRNDDMLYVPTTNLDSVRKYIGGGETAPRLNKLGGKEWNATTSKVKKQLQEVAKDLVELYAKRQKIKGYAFSKDTPWQRQFEDSFPYTETDDQLRCIEEVKKDMEKPFPMDRLLCRRCWIWKNRGSNKGSF